MKQFEFPGGKRFAFTIIDDTDVATVANVEPVYQLLDDLGMRATKTVWPAGCPEGSPNYYSSETLEDPAYRSFVEALRDRGFEITWHSATMESSRRERIVYGLERYREIFGEFPRIHINHGANRENLYWGPGRVDLQPLKRLMARVGGAEPDHYLGHRPGSEYWWGDLCERHIEYARNLTFNDINTARFNPSMPYRDPKRPLVPWWFSASDAEGVDEFNELLRPENQQRLEDERGFCIVATHLGKGFADDGEVNPVTRERLEMLASRPGWFPTVGELLDWLRQRRESECLPAREWRRMQWRWILDLARRKWDEWRGRHPRTWQGV